MKIAQRRSFAFWLAAVLLAVSANALAQRPPVIPNVSPPPRGESAMEKHSRLWREAAALSADEKLAEAIAKGEEALELDREIFTSQHEEVAMSLGWLAERYVDAGSFAKARAARKEELAILLAIYGEKDWRLADVRLWTATIGLVEKLSASDRAALLRAKRMTTEAVALRGEGYYEEGLKLAREALKIYERLLPDPHLDLAIGVHNVGYLLAAQAEFAEARKYYERALRMKEKLYSESDCPRGHPNLVVSFNNMAAFSSDEGDYAEAFRLYDRALAMNERLYPADEYPQGSPDIVVSLNNLGYLLNLQGRDYEAGEYLARALAMCERLYPEDQFPRGHQDLALCLNNVGYVAVAQGDFASARPYYERALAMYQKLYPEEEYPRGHPDLAMSLRNLGSLFDSLGDFPTARDYYEESMAMNVLLYPKDVYPDGHQAIALDLNNMGHLLGGQGDVKAARNYFERALAMRKRLYPADKFPQGHVELAASLMNMAHILQALDDEEGARGYFDQALAMNRALYPEDLYPQGHPLLAITLNNIGYMYSSRSEGAKAQPYFEQALAMRQKMYPQAQYPKGHPDLATSYNNLGDALAMQGRYDAALPNLQQAVDIYQELFPADVFPAGHPDLTGVLDNLGGLLVSMDDVAGGLAILERAERLRLLGMRDFFALSSAEEMGNYLTVQTASVDRFISICAAHPQALEATYRSELNRKTAVLDAIVRQRQFERLAAADPQIAKQAREARAARQQLADFALLPAAEGDEPRRAELAARAVSLEASLLRVVEAAAPRTTASEPDATQIVERLEPGEALVDIVLYEPYDYKAVNASNWQPARYAAFVLRGGDAKPVLVDLGEAAAIDEQVAELRRTVAATAAELAVASEQQLEVDYRRVAEGLSRRVFAPLAAHLEGVERIYLSPDGELNRVPFEALVDAESRYLIERFSFAYLAGGADLLRDASAPLGKGTVVFAAPDYNLDVELAEPDATLLAGLTRSDDSPWQGLRAVDTRGRSWTGLPATRVEANDVKELLKGNKAFAPVQVLLDGDALEGLLKRLASPRILHLATHGFYLAEKKESKAHPQASVDGNVETGDDNPSRGSAAQLARLRNLENPLLRSGIVLAGANREQTADQDSSAPRRDDGWVTAEEIAMLDLAGTDLVVLSACETGLGDVRTGQGVAGLRLAFMHAGARTLVTSLYKVPDQPTQALMRAFYQRLAAGDGKLHALGGAQREIIAARRKANGAAHPFFWASFILVGDPN